MHHKGKKVKNRAKDAYFITNKTVYTFLQWVSFILYTFPQKVVFLSQIKTGTRGLEKQPLTLLKKLPLVHILPLHKGMPHLDN